MQSLRLLTHFSRPLSDCLAPDMDLTASFEKPRGIRRHDTLSL